MKPLNPGESRHVGRYRLVAALGEGGMGRVLLGVSPDGRLVAVKQVHPGFAHDDGFRSRFRREVQASRMVSGAYTAAIMDAEPDAPTPWLASVFVAGPSLKEAVEAAGPLPLAAIRILAVGLASALTDIHRAGLIHRDLKPSNVLLTDDGARVIDFGIARAAEGDSELTHTGSIIGSPGFMSPEQADGRTVTPASDVFSLGGLLVMAATGQAPFGGGSTPQVLYNVVHRRPDLGSLAPVLRRLVEPCLAKDPAQRPTPAQILDHLGPIPPSSTPWPPAVQALIGVQKEQVGRVLALPRPPVAEAPATPGKRRRRLWPAVALTLAIVLGAATVVAVKLSSADQRAGSDAGPGTGRPRPAAFTVEDLREIDPCKLFKRDSLPATGPMEQADGKRIHFERCDFSFGDGPDKTASTTLVVNLYEMLSEPKGTPISIGGLSGFAKVDGIYCVVSIANPYSQGFAMTASSGRETGDPCATPTEAMNVLVPQIRYGTDARYPLTAGSALSSDLCATTDSPPVPPGNPNKFSFNVQGLHECLWSGQKDLGVYSVSLLSAPSEPGKGEQRDLDGATVAEATLPTQYGPVCEITWAHHRIDDASTEDVQLTYTNFDKKLSNEELCANAEQYARRVLAKLPPGS
ncbi:serine/threonine-protein kinase [Amycolatopsis sp. NPDC049159]|uniref:serine/threonine-protein kinase n=1 Tax=Amycolatopsis sp. NPDC049159 TaxID=3157210 RepID=UPI0034054014